MAKRSKKKEIAKKDKEAQKKFFMWTLIIAVLLIALMYMAYN